MFTDIYLQSGNITYCLTKKSKNVIWKYGESFQNMGDAKKTKKNMLGDSMIYIEGKFLSHKVFKWTLDSFSVLDSIILESME